MTLEELKELITSNIKPNNNREITGQVLQDTLVQMTDTLGEASGSFRGRAYKTTNPGTSVKGDFYLAVVDGGEESEEFTHFGLTIRRGLTLLTYDGSKWNPAYLVQVQNTEITDVGDYEFIPTVDAVYRYGQKLKSSIVNSDVFVQPLLTYANTYINIDTGDIVDGVDNPMLVNSACSDFLPLPKGIYYIAYNIDEPAASKQSEEKTQEKAVGTENMAVIAFYDANRRFIKGLSLDIYEAITYGEDIPESARYIRLFAFVRENARLRFAIMRETSTSIEYYPIQEWLMQQSAAREAEIRYALASTPNGVVLNMEAKRYADSEFYAFSALECPEGSEFTISGIDVGATFDYGVILTADEYGAITSTGRVVRPGSSEITVTVRKNAKFIGMQVSGSSLPEKFTVKMKVSGQMPASKEPETKSDFRIMVMQANDQPGDGISYMSTPEIFIPGCDNIPEGTEFFLWRKTLKARRKDISVVNMRQTVYKRPHFAPVFADPVDLGSGGPDIKRSNPVKLVAVKLPYGEGPDSVNGYWQEPLNKNGRGLTILVTKEDYTREAGYRKTIPKGTSLGQYILWSFIKGFSEDYSINVNPCFTGGGGFLSPSASCLYKKKERQFAISTTLENPTLIKFKVYMVVKRTESDTEGNKIHSGVLSQDTEDNHQVVLRAEAL